MTGVRLAKVMVGTLFFLLPALAEAAAIRVEARPGGVVGLGHDRKQRWSITHPSLAEQESLRAPIGPAIAAGRTFFAVRADLLEVDVAKGRIIGRTRFPATIATLAAASDLNGPTLLVTLEQGQDKVTVPFRPGVPRPGRGPWSYLPSTSFLGASWFDAGGTASRYDRSNPSTLPPGERDAGIAALKLAEAIDRTNPFLTAPPHIVDIVSIFLPLCLVFAFGLVVSGWSHAMGGYSSMPFSLQMDGAAAPDAERWVTALPPSAARDRLLDHVRREAEATRAGGRSDQPPPPDVIFIQAVETVPLRLRIRDAAIQAMRVHPLDTPGGWYSALLLALAVCVMFVIGGLIGRWNPKAAPVMSWLVPGGPGPLSLFGGLVGGLMISAVLALLGGDRILQMIAVPSRYFLLKRAGLSNGLPPWPPTLTWTYMTLVLCLILQVGVAWLDYGRSKRELKA